MKKQRVLVAMSGGIDSSVTAMLLHEQGYEVIGVTMKTWDYATSGGGRKTTGCCSLDDINDARALSVALGFQHIIIDIREEFGNFIVDNFVDEYLHGRTPNPCVLCNTHIKWDALMKRAEQLKCDYIATGHYANISCEDNRWYVSKGVDEKKDQSYVLWGVSQKNLSKTLLPLGKFTKTQIRKMAFDRGFEEISKKAESFEICFVPDNDYRGFLNRKVKGLAEKVAGGDFIDMENNVLGKHKGYPYYTIGQRKGLEIALGVPMYVVEILAKTNQVRLGKKEDLKRKKILINQINYLKYTSLDNDEQYIAKIRYKDKGTPCYIAKQGNEEELHLEFLDNVRGVAPGQSAVIYKDDDVVAGGIISAAFV